MPEYAKKHTEKIGLPPGSPIYIGEQKSELVEISVIDYGPDRFERTTVSDFQSIFAFRDSSTITWINIDGLHDVNLIQSICDHFGVHPLVVEDILSTQQRPKIEVFDDYSFIVFKMLSYAEREIRTEQISLILAENIVITFQEAPGDIFDPLRSRIETGHGRIRKRQTDYLAYAIMDVVVDNYFLITEAIGDEIEDLEESVLDNPDESFLEKLYFLRRKLIFLRKATWPLREVVSTMQRGEPAFIEETTLRFVGDLYDHTTQVIDAVETNRELVASILDVYLSMMSNRMNEVMKVLTIIATIFIPLSFLAGIYGMNFDTGASAFNMPELGYRYGYIIFWIISVLIGGGLLLFFKRKKWF